MVIDLNELFPETKDLDKRSVQALLTALTKAFTNDFDYLNYKKSIHALSLMEMEESMKFKSAFATAATMGVTKSKLLSSAKKYNQVLHDEIESFSDALKKQMYSKVEGKKDELNKIKERILLNERKIEELKKENITLQEAIDNADEHVALAKAKIEKTKTSFVQAYETIKNTIDKDITLINSYL